MDIEDLVETSSETNSQDGGSTIQNIVDSESSFNNPISFSHTTEDPFEPRSSLSLQNTSQYVFQEDHPSSFHLSSQTHTMSNTDTQSQSHQSNNWSNIPKLTSSSFFDWKRRLETTLGARRLSSHIFEDNQSPSDPKEKADYIVNDFRALKAIQFSCDIDNFNVISDCTTARSAYLALCKYHDDSGGVTTANLFSELASTKLISSADLKDHLIKFRNTHSELKGNLKSTPELRISDPFIAILLLKSLPPDFNSLVQTSLANFESLTLDRIYTLLNMEAKRLTGQSSETESALISISNRQSNKNKKKEQIKCSLGHHGHTDEKCRARIQNELEECKKLLHQQKINPESAKTATSSDAHISYYDHAFAASSRTFTPDTYDSGATSHMSPDESRFTNLTPIEPRPIGVAAQGVEIWATRAGSVSIGELKLDNVLFCKELTGTLISIGRLCDAGYRTIFTKT